MEILTLIQEKELKARVKELGLEISNDYKDKELLLVCILKGSIIFTADLSRYLNIATTEFEFIEVTSYGDSTTSSNHVKILKDVTTSLLNKHILVVEDILDTGHTLSFIIKHLQNKKPASIKICTLLNKPERRQIDNINVDYCGFVVPNKFVVGYGLDIAQKYRNLNYIGYIESGGE